jgi:hypothetical protein
MNTQSLATLFGGPLLPDQPLSSTAMSSASGGLGAGEILPGTGTVPKQGGLQPMDSLKGGFLVDGDPGATIHLDAIWSFREALYNNEVGVFAVDNLGEVNGIAPGEPGYDEAALRSESRRTLLQSGEQTGAWESFDALAGSQLAFYLIQNDSITN